MRLLNPLVYRRKYIERSQAKSLPGGLLASALFKNSKFCKLSLQYVFTELAR